LLNTIHGCLIISFTWSYIAVSNADLSFILLVLNRVEYMMKIQTTYPLPLDGPRYQYTVSENCFIYICPYFMANITGLTLVNILTINQMNKIPVESICNQLLLRDMKYKLYSLSNSWETDPFCKHVCPFSSISVVTQYAHSIIIILYRLHIFLHRLVFFADKVVFVINVDSSAHEKKQQHSYDDKNGTSFLILWLCFAYGFLQWVPEREICLPIINVIVTYQLINL